jgi:hypothetical protein
MVRINSSSKKTKGEKETTAVFSKMIVSPTGSVIKPKPTKKSKEPKTKPKKKYKLIGQKKDTPPATDSLFVFYTTLLKQKKNSVMALKWCIDHGVMKTPKRTEKSMILLASLEIGGMELNKKI